MENIKVRVSNEAESKEVQELFFELGYGFEWCKNKNIQDFEYFGVYYFFAYSDGDLTVSSDKNLFDFKISHKELTIQQLGDLVVLKRNDKADRNVIDPEYSDANLYLDSNENIFVFHLPTQKWKESNLNGEHYVVARLKPIEDPMKEYLVKSAKDGSYIYTQAEFASGDGVIEIPKGAIEARLNRSGLLNFIRVDGCWMNNGTRGEWFGARDHSHHKIIWQRNPEAVKVTIDELENCVGDESKYSHYRKDVSHLSVLDVYRVLELFDVTNPCLQHAVKKLLCSGQRGVKDSDKDIQEAIDSLQRYNEMRIEDDAST